MLVKVVHYKDVAVKVIRAIIKLQWSVIVMLRIGYAIIKKMWHTLKVCHTIISIKIKS